MTHNIETKTVWILIYIYMYTCIHIYMFVVFVYTKFYNISLKNLIKKYNLKIFYT